MHASVCVCCVVQVSGFYLSGGRCTHLDKCRSSTLAVNHIMFCKVHVRMCLRETKRDAESVWGRACGNISWCFQRQKGTNSPMADPSFDIHSSLFPFVFCIRYERESYLNHNTVKHDLAVVKLDRQCAQRPSCLKTLTPWERHQVCC